MSVTLVIDPSVSQLSWGRFCEAAPPYSIAIDGYVADGPRQDFSAAGPRMNFNHHEGVYRPATRATCAQALVEVRDGLFERFRDAGGPRLTVFANDCDEDVCTTWMILSNAHLAEAAVHPILNRLVSVEDLIDTFAGAYPFPKDLPVLQALAWVYEPYRRFRIAGGVDRRNATEFRGIVEDVERRILAHLTGGGKSIPLDLRYRVVRRGEGWSMVEELGAQARTAMLADGIRVFASVRQRPNGRRTVIIGKFRAHTPVDLGTLCAELNAAEGVRAGEAWGGGTTVIGSPLCTGTGLDDATISAIMDAHLAHLRAA